MRKRLVAVIAAVAAVMLAACDTQPATNVSTDSATLNAKGACTAGASGQWWYQLRNATTGSGFSDVGPRHGFSCTANTGELAFEAYRVGGLQPGHLYQFRLAAIVNGSFSWWDANGTDKGTAYDSFRTVDIKGHEDQNSGPTAVLEPCTPSGTDACTASNILRKKENLRNRFYWELFGGTVSDHLSFHSWGYNLTTKNIRWINRTHEGRCLFGFGSCSVEYARWRYAECDRSGADTCLFRSEVQVNVSFTYGVAFNRRLTSCLGTRINWDGSHVRNAFEGPCGFSTSRVARRTADVRNADLVIGTGRNAVKVGRYLSRADLERLDGACMRKVVDRSECKKAALSVYRGLPDNVREKVESGGRRS